MNTPPARSGAVDDQRALVQTIRVAPSTVIIFAVLLSPFFLPMVVILVKWGPYAAASALVPAAAYIPVLGWICSPVVVLRPGHLSYRSYQTGIFTRSIDLSTVVAASVAWRPGPMLVLHGEGRSNIVGAFGIKPFSRHGVSAIIEHVRASCPGVKLDRAAEAMRKGNFELVTRETLRARHLLLVFAVVVGVTLAVALGRILMR